MEAAFRLASHATDRSRFARGAPSLMTQSADYPLSQLEAYADQRRANYINEPMRTIAELLTMYSEAFSVVIRDARFWRAA